MIFSFKGYTKFVLDKTKGKKELFSWNFMEQSKINSDIRLIVACMTHMHV